MKMIQRRELVITIILSIVTCGIYYYYWMYCLNEDSKTAANEPNATSGGMVIILSIVTCGIYMYYWYYIMGKRMVIAMENNGLVSEDRSILYIILAIFGLGIVNDALIQNDLNTIADSFSNNNTYGA